RLRLGVAGRLNRNNAIRGGGRRLIRGLGGEFAGGLGFGLELLLEDLELLLLSGKAGTLVRLELIDLLAKRGDLRGGRTCLPWVALSTSFRTSIMTSLMLNPSVPIWRSSGAGEGAVTALAIQRHVAR